MNHKQIKDGLDLSCKTQLLQYDESNVEAILRKHGKTLEMLEKNVAEFRTWAQKEYAAMVPCDRKIASLLVLNDFCFEKTKEALHMNYALISFMPEFFVMLPKHEKLVQFARAHNLFPLPKLTTNHKRVFVSQVVDPKGFDGDGYMTIIFQICELCTVYDFNDGFEFVIDYELFTEKILKALTQAKLRRLYLFLEKVYSKQFYPVHGINLSENAIEFLKTCEKNLTESTDPFYIHRAKGIEALHQFYCKDVLPKEYGGNLKTLAEYREEWIKFLQKNNDYLANIQKCNVGENLRIREIKARDFAEFRRNLGELDE